MTLRVTRSAFLHTRVSHNESTSGKNRYSNQGLIFGDNISNFFLPPNQMRAHGVTFSNILKKFDSSLTHAVIDNVDDGDGQITLPLKLKGVISYLDKENPGD